MMPRPNILILTHPDDVHANAVQALLAEAHVPVIRVDTADLGTPGAPVTAYLSDGSVTGRLAGADLSWVTCVWHRRPSEFNAAALDAAELRAGTGGVLASLPHLNHPADMAKAALKPLQLTLAGRAGLLVPDTCVTTDTDEAIRFADRMGGYLAVVVKPLSGKPASLVRPGDRSGWARAMSMTQRIIDAVAFLRMTVVDDMFHTARIESPHLDWRQDLAAATVREVPTPRPLVKPVLELMGALGLRYAALDFAVDRRDQCWFLELNPNGQWLFVEDRTSSTAISHAVATALCRVSEPDPEKFTRWREYVPG